MNQKNNTKAPTYNSKLYATCRYIIDNTDLFNDYLVDYKIVTFKQQNEYLSLHNTLINSFNFLTGKSNKNKEGLVKGSNIMPSLMLDKLPEEKLAVILKVFYEYTSENPKNTARLFNINNEKCITLIDSLIEKINFAYLDDSTKFITEFHCSDEREQLKPNDYCKILDRLYNCYRKTIIKEHGNYLQELTYKKRILDTSPIALSFYLDHSLDFYHKILFGGHTSSNLPFSESIKELERNYPYFGNLKNIYYAWLYCDLCCYSLLQYITRLLTSKRLEVTPKNRETLNSIILNLIQEYCIQNVEPKGTPEQILFYFTFYYYKKDLFLQDTYILKFITEHCGKRENPKPEYNICQRMNDNLTMKEIQTLFTEGEQVSQETFRKNYNLCVEGINKYNEKTDRKISTSYLGQKVFYREIFADKTLYPKTRRTSHRIFSDFCSSNVIGLSDYYFLNEKINMGMYRERGLIDEFYAKNEFQENLYHLIILILSRLYPDQIQKITREVFKKITTGLKENHIDGLFKMTISNI